MTIDHDNPGGWRAHVDNNALGLSLRILLGQRTATGFLYVTSIDGGGTGFSGGSTIHVDDVDQPPDTVNLHLREDAARALYDALAQHFAGEAGGRQTRADLMHERGRVDKMIDALATIAKAATQ